MGGSPEDSGSAFILQAPFSGWLRSDGALMHYPAGSRLRRNDSGHWSLNGNGLEPVEALGRALEAAEDAVEAAQQFLGAPYLWAGKRPLLLTAQGCSGGLEIDGAGRATRRAPTSRGRTVYFVGRATARGRGVLSNEAGKVVHVGILLDATTIVHRPERYVYALVPEGIQRDDRVTHAFHSIRRWSLKAEARLLRGQVPQHRAGAVAVIP